MEFSSLAVLGVLISYNPHDARILNPKVSIYKAIIFYHNSYWKFYAINAYLVSQLQAELGRS